MNFLIGFPTLVIESGEEGMKALLPCKVLYRVYVLAVGRFHT